jgi:hypothetical protein
MTSKPYRFRTDRNRINQTLREHGLTMCKITRHPRWFVLGGNSVELHYQGGQWLCSCPKIQQLVNKALGKAS